MKRLRLILAAAAAVALVTAAPGGAAATKLVANVGPSPTITLTKGGKKVTTLKPGSYSITVNDKSTSHNFHLTGPGVNKLTTVALQGDEELDRHAEEGHVQVCLRPAQELHEGLVPGRLSRGRPGGAQARSGPALAEPEPLVGLLAALDQRRRRTPRATGRA